MGDWAWASWTAGGVLALIGLSLLLWALRGDRSRGRRRCPRCWYDMAKTSGAQCPECGRTQKAEKRFFRSRRRWGAAALSVLVLVLSLLTAVAPAAYTGQWLRWTPPILLRAVLSLYTADATQEYERAIAGNYGGPYMQLRSTWTRLLIAYGCREQLRQGHIPDATPVDFIGSPPAPTTDAVLLLGKVGDESVVASDIIVELASGKHPQGRNALVRLADGLAAAGSWLEPTLRRLCTTAPDPETRRTAIAALIALSLGSPAASSEAVSCCRTAATSDDDPTVRLYALMGAGRLDDDADSRHTLLVDRMRHDPDPLVRRYALFFLSGSFEIRTMRSYRTFAYRSRDNESALALRSYSEASNVLLMVLRTTFTNGMRRPPNAVTAPASAAGMTDLLIEALSDEPIQMRIDAAEYLGTIGPPAAGALPAIERALGTRRDDAERTMLLCAYASIATVPQKVEVLTRELTRSEPLQQPCLWALNSLSRQGSDALESAEAITRLMEQHRWAMEAGAATLVRIGEPAAPFLKRLLNTPQPEVHAAIYNAIVLSKDPFCMLGDELRRGLKDPNDWSRYRAISILQRCTSSFDQTYPAANSAFSGEQSVSIQVDLLDLIATIERSDPKKYRGGLTSTLTSSRHTVRIRALEALGSIGPAAAYAIPDITRCLDDHDAEVRDAAKAALRKIQPDSDTGGVK